MHIISGFLKGKKLKTLEGNSVRPTTGKIKESIFSIIQFELQNKTFLDLFSGSGQIGLEALSRGAKEVFFVDNSKKSINVIKTNLKNTNLLETAHIVNSDSITFLKKTKYKFDIAFLDPPYGTGALQQALKVLPDLMNDDGIIICENSVGEALPQNLSNSFILKKIYKYGKIQITLYRKDDLYEN